MEPRAHPEASCGKMHTWGWIGTCRLTPPAFAVGLLDRENLIQ